MKSNSKAIDGRSSAPCSPSSLTPETDAIASMRRTITEWKEHSEKLERERDNLRTAMKKIMACGLNCKDALDEAEQMERIAKDVLSENNLGEPLP